VSKPFRPFLLLLLVALPTLGCGDRATEAPGEAAANETAANEAHPAVPEPAGAPDAEALALSKQAAALFPPLPDVAPNPANPQSDAKVELGRALFFDTRLSKNHDVACNSCHVLAAYGVDGEPTSPGHRGQRGARNSPTVYNAALHIAQFWDGRAPDVEAQAKGPILNPVEMAMPSAEAVVAVLDSIPGYRPLFAAAFPGDDDPITYDHLGMAIGAFERVLMTPGPIDAFASGDLEALDAAQRRGLATFLATGCTTCHVGPAIGGGMYQKLGLVHPYETDDPGRSAVTGRDVDLHVFKVPSLRNVTETGPWFHDGSITDLGEAVRKMAHHQLGVELSGDQVADVTAFLGALRGELPADRIAAPTLPESGPDTPAPDPS